MNIQLKAIALFEGYYDEVPLSEADMFSLYVGEPGGYNWIADFATLATAEEVGHLLADRHGYTFVDDIIR